MSNVISLQNSNIGEGLPDDMKTAGDNHFSIFYKKLKNVSCEYNRLNG